MEYANISSRWQGILILLFSICVTLPDLANRVSAKEYCEEEYDSGGGPSSSPSLPPPPLPNPPSPPPAGGDDPSKPIKIVGNYPKEGRGTVGKLENWDYYESPPNPRADRALIALHDTGGFQGGNGNVRQVVDVLSAAFNFRIIMPNFKDILNWKKVKPGVEAAIAHIKSQWDIDDKIGIFGWCAGGKDAYEAAQELEDDLKAAVLLHPYDITNNMETSLVNIPMYLIISQGEDKKVFEQMEQTLKDKGLATGLESFKLFHGFAGANGDFRKADIATAVEKAIDSTGKFLDSNVN